MKKILFILITIPLIFGSCEKEDNTPNSNSNPNNPTINTTTGYLNDQFGTVWKTTDSGVTWTQQGSLNNPGSINGISFVNTTTGYLNDQFGTVWKTTDSGVTWTQQGSLNNPGSINGISFP